MNKLSDFSFDPLYTNKEKIKYFYANALRNANSYKRVSAYFGKNVFSFFKDSLPSFIKNGGYMQLLISHDITKDDLDEIEKGYKDKKTLRISNKKIIEDVQNMCDKENYNLLSYLISVGRLDIKICYQSKGVYHSKYGIISDSFNNELIHLGSDNITPAAIENNTETFTVNTNFESPGKKELLTIKQLKDDFNDTWNNMKDGVETFDLPDPFIRKIIDKFDEKEISKAGLNPKYVKFDMDEERNVIITSNFDISYLFTRQSLGAFFHFLKIEDKTYKFCKLGRINEIAQLYELLLGKVKEDVVYSLGLNARKFFDIYVRDYKKLAILGKNIKDQTYFQSEDFFELRKNINSCIKRPLKDKQVQAAAHMIQMEKSLNFSVPGSGKTATVLGAFEYLSSCYSKERNVKKILVIGPRNCAKSWKDEYKILTKFTGTFSVPLSLVTDEETKVKKEVLLHDFCSSRIIIVNYDLILKIKDELVQLINEDTMVVFDEIHKVKNTESAKFDALKEIVKNTRYRVALTGTPLPNGYIDMFNMMYLLHDDYTLSYFKMYESSLKQYDTRYKESGLQNDELNNRLLPFYMRVNKTDLDVPPANKDHIIEVMANEKEKDQYFSIKTHEKVSFGGAGKLVKLTTQPNCDLLNDEYIKLICCDSKYYTTKIHAFLSKLEELNTKKCVVWCNFINTIKFVTEVLKAKGYNAVYIYGETPIDEREKIIDNFNYGNIEILVTNPATLAESVSLHKKCHEAHYLELDYNLYHFLQSKDRIHRLGLLPTDETNYYIYVSIFDDNRESKDLEIYDRLHKKELLQKKAIDRGNFIFAEKVNIGDYE